MTKKKQNVGDDIIHGLTEAVAFARGGKTAARVHVPAEIDVRAIRKELRMTQAAFADWSGLPIGSIREWEQGRRNPDRAARVLLTVIHREPEAVTRALADARESSPH